MFEVPDIAIFDLDNTLYEYDSPNQSGHDSLVSFLSTHLGTATLEIERMLSESRVLVKERLGNVASSHSRAMYVRELINNYSFQTHSGFSIECEQVFWRAYLEKMTLFPGAAEIISYFRLAGTKMVLVTDLSTHIQLRKLAWLGLDKTFEVIITSEEAGGDKQTGLPEALLRKYITPSNRTWSIGDNNFDHIFAQESTFYKKVNKGKLCMNSDNSYQFSNYSDLLRELNVNSKKRDTWT